MRRSSEEEAFEEWEKIRDLAGENAPAEDLEAANQLVDEGSGRPHIRKEDRRLDLDQRVNYRMLSGGDILLDENNVLYEAKKKALRELPEWAVVDLVENALGKFITEGSLDKAKQLKEKFPELTKDALAAGDIQKSVRAQLKRFIIEDEASEFDDLKNFLNYQKKRLKI